MVSFHDLKPESFLRVSTEKQPEAACSLICKQTAGHNKSVHCPQHVSPNARTSKVLLRSNPFHYFIGISQKPDTSTNPGRTRKIDASVWSPQRPTKTPATRSEAFLTPNCERAPNPNLGEAIFAFPTGPVPQRPEMGLCRTHQIWLLLVPL